MTNQNIVQRGNESPYQIELHFGYGPRPAVAIPVAWLLQLWATLDEQPNSLTMEQIKHDLKTVLVRHCDLVADDLANINVHDVYEYKLAIKDEAGGLRTETLVATDEDNAREEASYEFDGEVVKAVRGERQPDGEPWHEWPEY